jgi:DNA-binding NtrC family response regulator
MDLQSLALGNGSHSLRPGKASMAPGLDREIAMAARTDACVLVTGSREQARALALRIHAASGWRHGPFIAIDCGWPASALEPRLVDSLTGADPRLYVGRPHARLAQPGTVFLQEVGLLRLAVQERILHWIAERRTEHGRSRRRLMASSSDPLLLRVQDGAFDDRLFYRLNTIHFVVSDYTAQTRTGPVPSESFDSHLPPYLPLPEEPEDP